MTIRRKTDFSFKQFALSHDRCIMKVGTDAVLLGAKVLVNHQAKILDIGTGCGIIAMMIAQRFPEVHIDAIERDENSAAQALENVTNSIFKSSVKIIHSSLQNYTPATNYDAIISNPPYFENSLLGPDDHRNSVRHTLELTFDDILRFAANYLNENGKLTLILPYNTLMRITETGESFGFFLSDICEIKSHADKKPNRIIVGFTRSKMIPDQSELVMFEKDRIPTEEYRNLTREFYLQY